MKTAISLPEELFARTEAMRKDLDLSRSEFYQIALREYCDKRSEQVMIEAINSVLEEDPGAGRIDPVLERMQFASLPVEKWT